MQRREFIRLFRGVAAAWSLDARAQQPERIRRVAAFTRALQDLGWHAGRNVRIDYQVDGTAEGGRTQTSRVVLMFNPATSPASGSYFLKPVEAAAPLLKMAVVAAPVHNASGIEPIMVSLARGPSTGLIVMPDIFILAHREQIIALANRYRLPAAYAYRLFPASGGLMSYRTDLVDLFRRAAPYVDRILKGEEPADLPVQTPPSTSW
jgi:hypothetical protein